MVRVIIFLVLIPILGCIEEQVIIKNFPSLKTLPVSNNSLYGAVFSADVKMIEGVDIESYGFIWGQNKTLTLTTSEKYFINKPLDTDHFSASITRSLESRVKYFVRAFLITNEYTIYGNVIQFNAMGSISPVIHDVNPKKVYYQDTLFITGENFSYITSKLAINLDTYEEKNIIESNDSSISIFLSDRISHSRFQVTVSSYGHQSNVSDFIEFIPPRISEISKQAFYFGDTVEILGDHFGYNTNLSKVYFNDQKADQIFVDSTRIEVVVPICQEPIQLKVFNSVGQKSTIDNLELLDPKIYDFAPKQVVMGEKVIIYGENFGYMADGIEAKIGGLKIQILSISNNTIELVIPHGIYPNRFLDLSISNNSDIVIAPDKVELINPWIRKNNFPVEERRTQDDGSVSFTVLGKAVVGLGDLYGNTLWIYEEESDSWSLLTNFPGSERIRAINFSIGDYAYIGGGMVNRWGHELRDFWRYNMVEGGWEKLEDIPIDLIYPLQFVIDNKAYVLSTNSRTNNFYLYEPETDTWFQEPDFSEQNGYAKSGFVVEGRIIVAASDFDSNAEIFEYNIFSDTWIKKSDLIVLNNNSTYRPRGESIGQFGYLFYRNSAHRYDINTDTWVEIDVYYHERHNGSTFVLNNILYFGGGYGNCDTYGEGSEVELWQYDPTYEMFEFNEYDRCN